MSKIVVYSDPKSPYCARVKKKLLALRFPFKEINILENHRALLMMIRKSNQIGVPVLEIKGQVIVGFDEERLNQLLGQ